MKLLSSRSLESLRPTLQDPDATGPDPVYWVFSDISDQKWANLTVLASGRIGEEYSKTFGHYHPDQAPIEVYHIIDGQGVMILEKKKIVDGRWIEDQVEAVFLVKLHPGDEISIPFEWGHSLTNLGDTPLITFDDWRTGHTPEDYAVIGKLHGMAYYIIDQHGTPTPVANSSYQDLPEPIWMSAEEFKNHS